MPKTMTGTGRINIFPLLHLWPDTYGVCAYTTTGSFGIEAVLGYIPLPELPDVRLMDIAARHAPQAVEWALCTGWSARSVAKPAQLDLPDATWTLEIDASGEPAKPVYGHSRLHTGRIRIDIPQPEKRAREVLAAVRRPARTPA